MKLIIKKDYQEMSKEAFMEINKVLKQNQKNINISITGGRTPLELYKYLIPEIEKKENNNVHYYNFDEIPMADKSGPGVTRQHLTKCLYGPAKISSQQLNWLDETNFKTWDKTIEQNGGLDLVVLGIGADGHYCGNCPGKTVFNDWTRECDLDPEMAKRIAFQFANPEKEIPDNYITMGPRSIMSAKKLVLIANGSSKAGIIKTLFEENLDENIPASILMYHPDLTIILDNEAATLIKK